MFFRGCSFFCVTLMFFYRGSFVFDTESEFSESFDADRFPTLLLAVNGQEEISDESCENLHHQTLLASEKVLLFT